MAYADRIAGWQTWLATYRTQSAAIVAQNATLTSVMAGVSVNTISAQNITDINAAITASSAGATALATATTTAGWLLTRPDNP